MLNHPQRYLQDYQYIQAGLDKKKMCQAAYRLISVQWKRNNTMDNITDFFYALNRMKEQKPVEFLNAMKLYAEYMKYLHEYAKFRNTEASELIGIWKKYEEDAEKYNDWKEWGNYILCYNRMITEARNNKVGVRLSTMHGSKGLEWKYVFIIDCIEGVYPYVKAEKPSEIEEERRLFYVAMTRAKEYLYMFSYLKSDGKSVKQSPFVPAKKRPIPNSNAKK